MKKLKTIYKALIILIFVSACTEDERSLDFLDNITAPTNVAAVYNITQDNSGLVTITPTAEGAASFDITFGDGTTEPESIEAGKSVQHTYAEGNYQITIVAYNTKGDTTSATQDLVVSFLAPQNLVVTIDNDAAITKQVNISATADFATTYEFYSGEIDVDQPVATANIGEALSYQYTNAGTYAVKVIAKGGAIETTEYATDFEVTEILAPLEAAPQPVNSQSDVISIYSDSYTNPTTIDYYPNWGQTTAYSEIEVQGNKVIQYSNITYQGIDFATNPIDASAMEFVHIDVWTAQDIDAKLSPISSGPNETAYDLELNKDQWTSFDIPISFFTDANPNLDFADLIQFKLEGVPSGEGSIFIDNLYLYKVPSGVQTGIVGTWKMSSVGGALGVGPSVGDTTWWNCDANCVEERACYYDDTYVFEEDGTFKNVLGSDTWIEDWQGAAAGCGTPVAPHDGSNAATYVYNESSNTVTLNGVGAYIGLPKANNAGELTNPADAPASITYNLTFTDPNSILVTIETGTGSGTFWQFKLERVGVVSSPLTGSWQMSSDAGSLGVGPSVGDITWWNCDANCVAERACYYDDVYVFGADGSFSNILGSTTWIEDWQGTAGCGAPVAPHDGSNPATYSYSSGKLTLNGVGAFIGLPKATNTGEIANPADAPESIVYDVSFIDNNTISVVIETGTGSGTFWQFKLVRI